MARRGLLAQLIHQSQVAAREQRRAQLAAVRQHDAAVRRAEQAQKAAERAEIRFARATEAERKRLEKEAKEAHIAAMEAKAEECNLRLAETYADLDELLTSTLDVDDYVDLESFRVVAVHPPFSRQDLETAGQPPKQIPDPRKPIIIVPDPPKGIAALFMKGRHAAALARARENHDRSIAKWREEIERVAARRQASVDEHARVEERRVADLEAARATYSEECAAREAEATEQNTRLDALISNLGYGVPEAVQEYISIVLSNSVYPDHFEVTHEFDFDAASAELRLRVHVPAPEAVPTAKAYKYAKATDEVTKTELSQKACRDRYASAVHQVALRSIHEVFESDRRGLIKTISLVVGTETVDPATGRHTYIPFVAFGAERDSFLEINLSAVVPALTLDRLGAAVSKNPYSLVAVETTGVRRS